MAEYIERNWLYDQLNSMGQEFDLVDTLELIEKFPAADVVPVVRCRECKYRTQETRWTRAGFCGRCGAGDFFVAKPDGFCSYGERKEDADNG